MPKGFEAGINCLLDEPGDRAAGGGKLLRLFALEEGLCGYVERDQAYGPARMEHDMRGVWVRVDIKFGVWCHVAGDAQCAAHDYHFAYVLSDVWFFAQRQGDIGQRTNRYERDFARHCHNFLNDEVYRVLADRLSFWLGYTYTANA